MTIQEQTLSILRSVLGGATKVALVDIPNHQNAGDSLILLGEIAYLKMLGIEVAYIADIGRFSAADLRTALPDGPVLLHGGGNFGDLWPARQAVREMIISEFHERRVVQLPQSVHFGNPERLTHAQLIINRHPDLHLLIRDRAGASTTERLFPNSTVTFCPDMAFGIDLPQLSRIRTRTDLIMIRRRDIEATRDSASFAPPSGVSYLERDWGLTGIRRAQLYALRVPGSILKRVPRLRRRLRVLQYSTYIAMAQLNVQQAIDLLQLGDLVFTDRLHAAVLGILTGKRVVAIDNGYGKVSSIFRDYLHLFPEVRFANTADEAQSIISKYLLADRSS